MNPGRNRASPACQELLTTQPYKSPRGTVSLSGKAVLKGSSQSQTLVRVAQAVLDLARRYRLPETTRAANQEVGRMRREALGRALSPRRRGGV